MSDLAKSEPQGTSKLLIDLGPLLVFFLVNFFAPVDPLVLSQKGSLFLTRPTLWHYIATRAELLSRAGDLFSWIAAGELDVRIGAEFPLADVGDGHRALEGRRTTGKVLLRTG